MDHVTSQLPYAMLVAIATIAGYLVLGFTKSAWLGFATTAAVLAVIVLVIAKRKA